MLLHLFPPTENRNKPFPCFKLPAVAQGHVVGVMDKIKGSLVSPNFRVAVARADIKLYSVEVYEKRRFQRFDDVIRKVFGRPAPTIKISSGEAPTKIKFFWLDQKDPIDRLLKRRTRVKIREDLWMACVQDNILIYSSSPRYSKLNDYRFILDILFGTFTVNQFYIAGTNNHLPIPKDIMFPLAQQYLKLASHVSLTHEKVSVDDDLTSEELSALLDNLEDKTFRLLWRTVAGVKYTGTLKMKRMKLEGASWLTLDNLLTMKCEHLEAYWVSLSVQELNSFVRKWQEGGFEKLETLILVDSREEEVNWFVVLDEIQGEAVPAIVPYRALQKVVCQEDGKKAVVKVNGNEFHFKVFE